MDIVAVRTVETPTVQVEAVTARRRPHVARVAVATVRPAATVGAAAPDRPVRGGVVVTELQTIRA